MKTLIAAGLILAAGFAAAAPAAAQTATRLRLQCTAEGATDHSISARFEQRGARRKFDASFEAAPGLGWAAGQFLTVRVGSVNVGTMRLIRDAASGDIIGDLEFDTRVDNGNPFPANFPAVRAGANVRVGPLACALR
ncbi:MAG TPA: hypothetical protein DDZ68_00125 [Parvularcula sp.]|nr:hypothetical protein [Parvularcula sp.]HBS33289.1 hypothetical protein [Parvularcula sp.]HBS34195.1 hypothetical protein [Parvularcula sp.]